MRAILLSLFLAVPAAAVAPPGSAAVATPDEILLDFLWDRYQALPKAEKPKTALVLSGGGARALAHVGVIEVLVREGFDFDIVAGTSMGSLIGVLYSAGFGPDQMRDYVSQIDLTQGQIFNKSSLLSLYLRESYLSSAPLEDMIHKAVGGKNFSQLQRRFGCVATDLRTGEKIIFREGPVAPAVRSSMNFPGFFAPVEYRHRLLVDGGVVDYIPVDVGKLLGGEWILASMSEGEVSQQEFTSVLRTLEQVIDIRGSLLARDLLRQVDVVVEPRAGQLSTFDFHRMGEAINLGVIAGQKQAPQAKQSLALKALSALVRDWMPPKEGAGAPREREVPRR